MTVLNVWDGVCEQKDLKNGSWNSKRIVIGRSSLHVVSDDEVNPETENERKRRKKGSFNSSVSYNLNMFKMEVGFMEANNVKGGYYCLFLVSGHTKVTFGFLTKIELQVK